MIEIDGNHGEGGGQIIRTAIAFSALSGRSVRVRNIRSRRGKAGLRPQHKAAVEAVARMCGGRALGAETGSGEVTFHPDAIREGEFRIEIGTAGSVTLLAQCLLPIAAAADGPVLLFIKGGTDVNWSPSADYFERVFLPFLSRMGISIRMKIPQRGFYPAGGGCLTLTVEPWKHRDPLYLPERKGPPTIRIISVAGEGLRDRKVAERQAEGFRKSKTHPPLPEELREEILYAPSETPGTAILGMVEYENTRLGAVAFGELGKPAERVGREAAEILGRVFATSATLDPWMTDQIVPYLVFTGGSFRIARPTSHLETNLWVLSHFIQPGIAVDETSGLVTAPEGGCSFIRE